jgi:hypothetical protein
MRLVSGRKSGNGINGIDAALIAAVVFALVMGAAAVVLQQERGNPAEPMPGLYQYESHRA